MKHGMGNELLRGAHFNVIDATCSCKQTLKVNFRSLSARSRKISSNWSTDSEALARKPNQTFNVRENIISQGLKTRIWGNLEDSHLSRARF